MNFDGIARFYRALEFVAAGGKLQRCRVAFLPEITTPRRVLLAGEGHGRFLPECARVFPEAEILVVDASAQMLEIARSKTHSRRVRFLHSNVLDWAAPAAAFDLIVTHFVLDCLTPQELPAVIRKLGVAATPQAAWLLADFEHAATGPARWRTRAILAMLYRFFRMVSCLKASELVPPDHALRTAGFRRNARKTYEWGLLKSEWWTRDSPDCGPCGQTDAGL